MSTKSFFRRALVMSATVGVAGIAGAGIASAHVTADVYGKPAEKGGYGAIVLRVPNEEQNAGTTKIEVTLPENAAISSARTKPVPGWTADIDKNGDVVTKITWTAEDGNEIPAGTTAYQEFAFTAGPLPEDQDSLVLATKQTYSDGTVADWAQPSEGDKEPDYPAPVVELAASSGDGHGASGSDSDSAESAESTEHAASATDDTARWLGGAGLIVGALGLGFGAGATLRARKKTSA